MGDVVFNKSKFRELMLYVATESASDPKFGRTKLNKILFFSDFLAYAHLGSAITGATYQRLDQGPAPRELVPVRKELIAEGAANEVARRTSRGPQMRLVALRPANLGGFDASETAVVDQVVDSLSDKTAAEVSDLSHLMSIGWRLAQFKEEIPYRTVFLSYQSPTQGELELAQEIASRHGCPTHAA